MCGIAALFEPSAPTWLAATVQAMTRAVRHRGPDGEGFLFYCPGRDAATPVISEESPSGVIGGREVPSGATLALGHRRLSILDLSIAGHQPMADEAGTCWITFNGEIYNYAELRRELAPLGHVFRSGTDTEVILAAWREWDEACLSHFNGMFAFVIFDRTKRRLFAARDRFGVKPLYLWRTPSGGVAFASEIKQFTIHPRWQARLHGQRAYDFLNWGLLDHTHETLFADVVQLRGGEFLSASLDQLPTAQPERWYQLQSAPFTGNFTDAANRFRELLDDSVRLRLRADVPVGSCLSGGLDSSSIVTTVRTLLGDQAARLQKTFSAWSDVPRFDERGFIQEVVARTGAAAHQVIPEPDDLFRELDALAWHQDEPFGSTSIYAQWRVFELARANDVIVMLDGQGADEALGGYHGYFAPRLAGLMGRGQWRAAWQESAAVRSLHGQSWFHQAKLLGNELTPAGLGTFLRRVTGHTVPAPEHLDLGKMDAHPTLPPAAPRSRAQPVRVLGHAQLTALTLPMLLHYEDRNSMAHSVEARLPFLDYRLVEFCLGLPEEFKVSEGWTKRVLREGMRDRLPERIRTRRDKLGFATAEEVWMTTHSDAFLDLLDEAIDSAGGILTPAARRKVQGMLAGRERFSFLPWRFISFGRWLRRFNVQLPSRVS